MRHARTAFSLPISLESEVREMMTPGVVSMPDDASLGRAQEALVAHDIHALLVTDRHTGAPTGWVTPRGLLPWATSRAASHTAKQAISEPVHTISPSASVLRAIDLMLEMQVSHLLVSSSADAMPEGVVSDTDVVRLGRRT